MRRLFEFSGDETFWMVAENKEQAEKGLREDYNEEELFEDKYTVKELGKNTNFKVEDEDTGIKYDVWEMIEIDRKNRIEIPYMIASTVF